MTADAAVRAHRPSPAMAAHARLAVGIASLWLLLSAVALAAVVLVPVLFGGWSAESVASGSMSPAIKRGDVVLTASAPHRPLAIGTVISFERSGRSVTHRIVRVNPDGSYVTRGDANAVDDPQPVPVSAIKGVVHRVIPYLGLPREWARTGDVLPLLAIVVLAVALSAAAADVLAQPVGSWWPRRARGADV